MLVSGDRFVPRDQVQRLTEGSYEGLIQKLGALVSTSSEKLFGRAVAAKLIGTFHGYGLAESVDGDVTRFQFETALNGQLVLTQCTPVKLKSMATMEYVGTQTRATVDALLVGQVDKAFESLRSVVPMLSERTEIKPQKQVTESIQELFALESPWKTYYGEKVAHLPEFQALEQLEPKFARLYDGSISGQELTPYTDLVQSDFKSILDRYSILHVSVQESVKKLLATKALKDDCATLCNFAEDFAVDLETAVSGLQEVQETVFDVGSLGSVYDAAVRELSKFEIADAYLKQMTSALTDPG